MIARSRRKHLRFGLLSIACLIALNARARGAALPNALFPQFSWASARPRVLQPLARPTVAAVNPLPRSQAALSTISSARTDPSAACDAAVHQAQAMVGTPIGLLRAIATVESGQRNPTTGQIAPWPWTIDADGTGHFYATESQAIAAVRRLRRQGVKAIDVGCLQIDLAAHPDAFATLREAFDPLTNALYGARFLRLLRTDLGHWAAAIGGYHSLNPTLGTPYFEKVSSVWQQHNASPVRRTPTHTLILAAAKPAHRSQSAKSKPPSGAIIAPPGYGAGSFQFVVPPQRVIQTHNGGMGLAAYRARPVLIAGAR